MVCTCCCERSSAQGIPLAHSSLKCQKLKWVSFCLPRLSHSEKERQAEMCVAAAPPRDWCWVSCTLVPSRLYTGGGGVELVRNVLFVYLSCPEDRLLKLLLGTQPRGD
jgi:hypothetical protein